MSVTGLHGRTALVTGAGRGIGRAIAVRLAADGARVLCAGRDAVALEGTAAAIVDAGGDAHVVLADLREPDAVAALADEPVDVLVANSGIAGPTAPAWEVEPEAWAETLAVNLTGTYLLCRALVPGMIERGAGSVVAVGSTTAGRPLLGRAPYAASKAALVGFVRSLALDAGPHGVRANLVVPGPTGGERLDAVIERQAELRGGDSDGIRARMEAAAPLGRLPEGEDVAAAVSYLAGDDARAITGAELVVSAGSVMA